MTDILSREEFENNPWADHEYAIVQLSATVEALAEAFKGEIYANPRECAMPGCKQCARVNELHDKGWLE